MKKPWNLGYEKSKQKAKEIYSKIGRIQSPAFGGELVAFTSAGFNHLVRKGRIPRPKNEQKRRFTLIPYVEQIIKNPKATLLYERRETRYVTDRHGKKVTIQSVADFWTFVEIIENCKIKVVVRQLDTDGPKHFLSVMGDDATTAKRRHKIKKPPK